MNSIRKIALIGGAGMMGRAIVEGIIDKGLVAPDSIVVTARHEESLARIRIPDVEQTVDNVAAASGADVIILCVHPGEYKEVLVEILPVLEVRQLLISVVTGISIMALSRAVEARVAVVRTSPNIAAIVGASMTALCAGPEVSPEQMNIALTLFQSIGEVVKLDERHLNAATGLAGCGPAFAFRIIESLAEGGIKMGLPREIARRMAAQVLRGAGQMVLDTGRHPAYLKDTVLTPGAAPSMAWRGSRRAASPSR
ncbi:MAG: pyrroline-5-carboxylate reductase [Pseudomonadota bacterium]